MLKPINLASGALICAICTPAALPTELSNASLPPAPPPLREQIWQEALDSAKTNSAKDIWPIDRFGGVRVYRMRLPTNSFCGSFDLEAEVRDGQTNCVISHRFSRNPVEIHQEGAPAALIYRTLESRYLAERRRLFEEAEKELHETERQKQEIKGDCRALSAETGRGGVIWKKQAASVPSASTTTYEAEWKNLKLRFSIKQEGKFYAQPLLSYALTAENHSGLTVGLRGSNFDRDPDGLELLANVLQKVNAAP